MMVHMLHGIVDGLHQKINEYGYTVNHTELEIHLENKRLVDKDGFMHLIPKYNREEL